MLCCVSFLNWKLSILFITVECRDDAAISRDGGLVGGTVSVHLKTAKWKVIFRNKSTECFQM